MDTNTVLNILTQMGAMGLLSVALIFGLPKVLAVYASEQEKMRQLFREDQHLERESCDRHFSDLMSVVTRNQENLTKALDNLNKNLEVHQMFAEDVARIAIRQKIDEAKK